MVEQENQQGQQYLTSQQQMEFINQLGNLNSSVDENWLVSGITNLREIANISQKRSTDFESQKVERANFAVGNIPDEAREQQHNIFLNGGVLQDPNVIDVLSADSCYLSDLSTDISLPNYNYPCSSPVTLWNSFVDLNNFKIDDVFQVDTADLFQGPTLAELNANDESLFDSLDTFDSCLPLENKSSNTQLEVVNSAGLSLEMKNGGNAIKETIKDNLTCCPFLPVKRSDLLTKVDPVISDISCESTVTTSTVNSFVDCSRISIHNCITDSEDSKLQAVPTRPQNTKIISTPKIYQMSSSERKHSDTFTAKKRITVSSTCDFTWDSPQKSVPACNDDELSNDDNTDDEYVFSSDDESDISEHVSHKRSVAESSTSNKKPRYFWQYNMQAKGPKGPKIIDHSSTFDISSVNAYVKVRRGDGNDLTPSPQKLHSIGLELQKLNSVINDLTPVNELPFNARPKSRKEKNKLASRACRLKKKAQHEANKLKVYGLQKEYNSLVHIIEELKKILKAKLRNIESEISAKEQVEALLKAKDIMKVAGCTAEFVNNVLTRVEAGDQKGGLGDL